MPPRTSLTSSFSITDANNEVVCPLRNQDGSSCRKRCIGEKRYRSMQEHIRRAHPEHYISKLPATEESFLLMIKTQPNERPQNQSTPGPSAHAGQAKGLSHAYHRDGSSAPGTPRNGEEQYTGAALLPAATALAQLHNHKLEQGWESDNDWHSDHEGKRRPRSSIELPPIHLTNADVTSAPYSGYDSGRPREILPSILSNSPPGRSSTLPPLHRTLGPTRTRRQSISKRGHQGKRSKGATSEWLRRLQNDSQHELLRPGGSDRKASSAEPSADFGKRWEDLIDAATSATEDIDEDRTPVSSQGPAKFNPRLTSQIPRSPVSIHRSSLPPLQQHYNYTSYQASPLQQALTPPSYNPEATDAFPSVESGESGENFHIGSRGLSDSSPSYSSQNTQIYCAACREVSLLRESYACTECICGLCRACVDVLMLEQGARRKCPNCATIGGRFKPFQLDIR
ncbi:hypothetical protein GE21DRAFT_1003985 [Neurospora crassa]|uniref:RING zinc finger-like domain-containing protein n=2 Tax=Neurospora TaxID=5140 RepID=A0AAJ0MNZ0_9PEZI|nr:uncharacterized protein NEUTE1DRAFT_105869 [Neurospora tetrasperma FGSC 2508]EGO52913.1 hypothetical protein NEUTE1DRAFT_105869 [Neurospora tetrasperma FGSC 2508]KAK3487314.1 hypothetical protein B0T13DRAFT_112345 [Neurospora crassa]KAK3488702.1 hypothetical protein B0T23DRAFT_321207 [Neurospora hispaniola]KHE90199.1 hypothetical protein GE21DRAFT_1003985 [Neurospora crassa]